jgi:hypothetical protein
MVNIIYIKDFGCCESLSGGNLKYYLVNSGRRILHGIILIILEDLVKLFSNRKEQVISIL